MNFKQDYERGKKFYNSQSPRLRIGPRVIFSDSNDLKVNCREFVSFYVSVFLKKRDSAGDLSLQLPIS